MPQLPSDYRLVPDQVLIDIVDYVSAREISSVAAYSMARYCVMDAIGCAVEALNFSACTMLLGPVVPGIICPQGARVPGTQYVLDPVSAAFNIGIMIRWLDFNDSAGAAEGAHPSDNLGAILATADHLSRTRIATGEPPLRMREVLTALIKAYELQGVLSMENSLANFGFDHDAMIRVASTAVVTEMLGGSYEEIINAVSNAWVDGVSLRIYRQGRNTGTRKSWAAGDATSRGVRLALMAVKGVMGYPAALTAKTFGFYDAVFKGQPFKLPRSYGSYVVENIRFKFIPAGMHGQTAAECAFKLHPLVKDRLDDIDSITIHGHRKLVGIMDKRGPLTNPADRDHCVQYVVAVALIFGRLEATDFEDEFAADPRIDKLRDKMTVIEDPRYTRDFFDAEKRSSANAIDIRFASGSNAIRTEIEYGAGHYRRRAEGIPLLEAKFQKHLAHRFPQMQREAFVDLCMTQAGFESTPVNEFMDRLVI